MWKFCYILLQVTDEALTVKFLKLQRRGTAIAHGIFTA